MNMFNHGRRQQFLVTGAPTSAQTTTAVIDTLGYDFVSVGVSFSTVALTTPDLTLKIGEGDTTSAFTDISALTGGTGFTIPAPNTNTSVANTMQFDIDTRTRKRYLQLSYTPFTTKSVYAWANFGKEAQGPIAATSDNLMIRVSA
jgi:hypothetical protein